MAWWCTRKAQWLIAPPHLDMCELIAAAGVFAKACWEHGLLQRLCETQGEDDVGLAEHAWWRYSMNNTSVRMTCKAASTHNSGTATAVILRNASDRKTAADSGNHR